MLPSNTSADDIRSKNDSIILVNVHAPQMSNTNQQLLRPQSGLLAPNAMIKFLTVMVLQSLSAIE